MRLIDADALYERTAEWEAQALHMVEVTMNDEDKTKWRKWSAVLAERSAFKHDIADAPTIEPERKTGVWLDDDENGKVMTSGYCPYCSVCKEMAECITKYCPHCGAEMEGVE